MGMTDPREVYRRIVDDMLRETDPDKVAELEELAREAWLEVDATGWGSAGLRVR